MAKLAYMVEFLHGALRFPGLTCADNPCDSQSVHEYGWLESMRDIPATSDAWGDHRSSERI